MDDIMERLKEWGCDVDGALERFMGDRPLYIECLKTFKYDTSVENLKHCLIDNQLKAAFEEAHTLKGVAINLGLTPIYDATVAAVEKLRVSSIDEIEKDIRFLEEKIEEYKKIV